MSTIKDEVALLTGAKGGGKGGGGGGRVAKEDPNTLRSNATARLIDVVSEGPIEGLVDGWRSVFLDDTPVQNEDGSFNFAGLIRTDRYGYPDQDPFPRQTSVEHPKDVSARVRKDTPLVRTINDLDADAVRITIQVPALTRQDKKTGDLHGNSVQWAVDVRANAGSWRQAASDTIEGKTTSPYQRSIRVPLSGTGPWDIRVRRLTDDSSESTERNETYWASYTELIDAKLIYPDTAAFGFEVDAQQFGDSIPARKFDIKGLIISVPSNYNPETREYSGLWDGTFKQAWTDNPAWVYYDMATHPRYGAGIPYVDKWALYQIGQYCDELVDDGYGAREPRFTFNSVISDQAGVYDALSQLASVFRGMTYWGTNTVMAVADMPATAVKLVTPANVIDGHFEYSGAARSGQHSAWLVSYNDVDSNDRLVPEIVEDAERIQRIGWKPANLTAVGCNSRGQARRVGLWARETERNEGETVTYTAAMDHADVRPGDIIKLQDPNRANARLSGRFVSVGTSALTLDKAPESIDTSQTWYIDAVLPSGGIERREISEFDGNAITLKQPLSQAPVQGGVWILASASIAPRLFRVVSNSESGAVENKPRYQITAIEHDPTKYARVEQGIDLEKPPTTNIPTGPIVPPSGITAESHTYLAGGSQHQALTVSITPSPDARVQRHIIEVRGPADSGWRTASNAADTSVELRDIEPGEWQIRARAADGLGRLSAWVYRTVSVNGLLQPGKPDSVDISVGTFTAQVTPRGLLPGATWEFWIASAPLDDDKIESNARRVGVGSSIALTDLHPDTLYYLYIRGVNVYGKSGWYPLQFTTNNDAAAVIAAISGKIEDSDLAQQLQDRLDLIDGPTSMAGSVAQRVQDEADAREQAVADEAQQRGTAVSQAYTDLKQYADDESSAALQTQQLVTSFGGNTANALSYTVSQVDSDLAVSTTFEQIDSQFQSVNGDLASRATITYVDNSVADESSARSQAIQQARSELGDDIAGVQQDLSTDIDNTNGRIEAMYSVRLQVDSDGKHYIGGWGLANDGETIQATFDVDLFSIGKIGGGEVQPFIVDTSDNNVYIDRALIKDLTFSKLVDDAGTFLVKDGKIQAKFLQTDAIHIGYSQVDDGPPADADKTSENTSKSTKSGSASGLNNQWSLNEDGTFQIESNSSDFASGRISIDQTGIQGYGSDGSRNYALWNSGVLEIQQADVIETVNIASHAVTFPDFVYDDTERTTSNGGLNYPGEKRIIDHNFPTKNGKARLDVCLFYFCNAEADQYTNFHLRVNQDGNDIFDKTLVEIYGDNGGTLNVPLLLSNLIYSKTHIQVFVKGQAPGNFGVTYSSLNYVELRDG